MAEIHVFDVRVAELKVRKRMYELGHTFTSLGKTLGGHPSWIRNLVTGENKSRRMHRAIEVCLGFEPNEIWPASWWKPRGRKPLWKR